VGAVDARVVERVVDTARYPLTEPGSAGWKHAVSRVRDELRDAGCSVLSDFVRASVVEELRLECAAIAPAAYYEVQTVNVYNTTPDPTMPADHPARTSMQRGNAFVSRDNIPGDTIVHQLYTSSPFRRFIAACVELPEIHELSDPLAGLCLNIVAPGRSHPWHFDTNEFAVSMLTQAPPAGGLFEYCPDIRSAREENLDDVRAVLAGSGEHLVRRLSLRPGDLQLFKGRYSLHRVSPVRGDTARHTAIFAYSQRAGVVGTAARTRQLFGRVSAAHLAGERAVRVDQLLD